MSLPLFPSNTSDLIEQMINTDGRQIYFYTVTYSGCSICSLDPISDTSVDSTCPTCSGEYWIPTYSGWAVTAHVTWGVLDNKGWTTGGMIDNGDCTVKFMLDEEAEDVVDNAVYAVVDDRIMTIQPGIILRGIPTPNRIIVKLKEKEK